LIHLLVLRDVVETSSVEDVLPEHDSGMGMEKRLVMSIAGTGDVAMLFVNPKKIDN
jgi:hypothetical protein